MEIIVDLTYDDFNKLGFGESYYIVYTTSSNYSKNHKYLLCTWGIDFKGTELSNAFRNSPRHADKKSKYKMDNICESQEQFYIYGFNIISFIKPVDVNLNVKLYAQNEGKVFLKGSDGKLIFNKFHWYDDSQKTENLRFNKYHLEGVCYNPFGFDKGIELGYGQINIISRYVTLFIETDNIIPMKEYKLNPEKYAFNTSLEDIQPLKMLRSNFVPPGFV
jgi:hypothetical protein